MMTVGQFRPPTNLRDSLGRFRPVVGAKSYAEVIDFYSAFMTRTEAQRWAQHNHDDLWTLEKQRLAAEYAAHRERNGKRT